MKKYVAVAILAILTAVMIVFPPSAEPSPATKTIYVTARVYSGDTLDGICGRLALKHGDVRDDLREIVYYTRRQNGIANDRHIQPGDKLIIPLVVPTDALGRR